LVVFIPPVFGTTRFVRMAIPLSSELHRMGQQLGVRPDSPVAVYKARNFGAIELECQLGRRGSGGSVSDNPTTQELAPCIVSPRSIQRSGLLFPRAPVFLPKRRQQVIVNEEGLRSERENQPLAYWLANVKSTLAFSPGRTVAWRSWVPNVATHTSSV
jgi:hypothetical protein